MAQVSELNSYCRGFLTSTLCSIVGDNATLFWSNKDAREQSQTGENKSANLLQQAFLNPLKNSLGELCMGVTKKRFFVAENSG